MKNEQKQRKLERNIFGITALHIEQRTKKRVERKVAEISARISAIYGEQIPFPTITYNVSGPCAGYAWLSAGHTRTFIDLNPYFLYHYDWRFVEEIVPHEVCHIGSWLVYGTNIKPHGHEWYGMMEDVGVLVIEPYHDFSLRKTKMRYHTKHLYKCMSCHTHYFETASEHNYIKARHKYAHCVDCGRRLTYIKQLGKISYNRCVQLYGRKSNAEI